MASIIAITGQYGSETCEGRSTPKVQVYRKRSADQAPDVCLTLRLSSKRRPPEVVTVVIALAVSSTWRGEHRHLPRSSVECILAWVHGCSTA